MKVGDLIEIDDYGIGAVSEIWVDEEWVSHASIWLIAEQRYIFINDLESFNENR